MVKIIRITILFLIITANLPKLNAQYYNGIGIRYGVLNQGFSFKRFINSDNTSGLEAIIGGRRNTGGVLVTALYEHQIHIHNSLLQIPLSWVIGAGGHIGVFGKEDYRTYKKSIQYYKPNSLVPGANLSIGMEYQLHGIPLTIGADLNPFFDFVYQNDYWLELSFAVRFVFN